MNPTVPIALFGWIIVVPLLFATLAPRRAVIVSFFGAWLFLPMASYKVAGLPEYGKVTATCVGVLLGIMLCDSRRLTKFRPSLWDTPMIVWCLVPFASAMSAGFGPQEGISGVLNQTVAWGIPYFVGRLYFTDLCSLRELAIGMVAGGLVYVPLCLFEIRMSPQLHTMVYGFHQHVFAQSKRGGGWRPTVFMQHGLAVGMFMCTAALVSFWLAITRSTASVLRVPIAWASVVLLLTAVLCKSTGATALLCGGIFLLLAGKWLKSPALVYGLMLLPVAYILVRTVGGWSGVEFIELAKQTVGVDRSESLATRISSENGVWFLVQHDLLFGLGRVSFAGEHVEETNSSIIPDGLWIIALGKHGLVGLIAMLGAVVVPPIAFVRKVPVHNWATTTAGGGAVLAIVLGLDACDNLFNALVNPIFMLAAGGLVSAAVQRALPVPERVPCVPR